MHTIRKDRLFQIRKTKRLLSGTLHFVNAVKGETKVKISLKESEIREIAENSAFFHPSKFYPQPKIVLKDAKIKDMTKDKLHEILEEYKDMSHQSTGTGVTTLEEVPIETDPNLPHVASKPYAIPCFGLWLTLLVDYKARVGASSALFSQLCMMILSQL